MTDAADLFFIEGSAVRACSALGPPDQTCRELVRADDVASAVQKDDDRSGPGNSGRDTGGTGGKPSLEPRALALDGGRVFVLDAAFGAVLACPARGACGRSELGVVTDSGFGGWPTFALPLGSALAAGGGLVAWSALDGVVGASAPPPGRVEGPTFTASGAGTIGARALALSSTAGTIDLFTLDSDDVHRVRGPLVGLVPSARVDEVASSAAHFAVDDVSVIVAGPQALTRWSRADRTTVTLASGEFRFVAADASGIFAAVAKPDGVHVVQVRKDALTELAVAPSLGAIAVAGDYVYFSTPTEILRVPK